MTDEDFVTLGSYCEMLLNDPQFNTLVELFNVTAFQNFTNTHPGQKDVREHVFNTYDGLRQFLGTMRAYVDQKNQLVNPEDYTALSSEEDDAQ